MLCQRPGVAIKMVHTYLTLIFDAAVLDQCLSFLYLENKEQHTSSHREINNHNSTLSSILVPGRAFEPMIPLTGVQPEAGVDAYAQDNFQ